jgi:molecular chaperone DnaK (HSP70)
LEDIHVIRTWPGKDGEWKTPTRIAYASENRKSEIKEDLWGYQVEPNMVSCSWIKLLLDADTKTTRFDDTSIRDAIDEGRLRLPTDRNAQGVAADFLTGLYKHMETKLVRELGQATFDSTPMDCWLTVPAVWSDCAQNATKAAALTAGLGSRAGDTISTILEPEAAAVAVLKNILQPEFLTKPEVRDSLVSRSYALMSSGR